MQAVDAASKDGTDVAICDTSGRLHNNWRLMEELSRCKAAIQKRMPDAPHEVLLVLDGTNGGQPPLPACIYPRAFAQALAVFDC